jgi:predicted secreted protein
VPRILSLFAALAVLGMANPAISGDAAQLSIIGFSQDGKYFAFEQYGEQDGSGFAYSDIFITDTGRNAWVKGSPFHVLAEDEKAGINEIRRKARAKARNLMTRFKIDRPADIIAANPVTEVVANRKVMVFDTAYYGPASAIQAAGNRDNFRHELQLSNVPVPNTENCVMDEKVLSGFSLSLRKASTGIVTQAYKDAGAPATRGCPFDYQIDTLASHVNDAGEQVFMVVVAYFRLGFEGPDLRFLAVPVNPL